MALRSKFAWTVLGLEIFFVVYFAFFMKYGPELDAEYLSRKRNNSSGDESVTKDSFTKHYPVFQDINVIVFVGIGLLYSYMRRYGYSGIAINFFLCAIVVQWSLVCQSWWKMKNNELDINVNRLMRAEFAAAGAVISLGAIFGKVGWLQMIIFAMMEVLVYTTLNQCSKEYLQIRDVGESVALHLFAAVFGCSAAYAVDKKVNVKENPNETSSYNGNIFCMLGMVLLWDFWPSFNAADEEEDDKHRIVINTFLALIGSGITCFAMSALLDKNNKFTMAHIQNGALAGAVSIGATCDLMIQPFVALAIGSLAGCLSVTGFKYFSPFLSRRNIHDPCGINSLHGLPGFFAGIISVIATTFAREEIYGYSLYKFYPAMAPLANTTAYNEIQMNAAIPIHPGLGRTLESQIVYQVIYIPISIIISCLTGLTTGAIMRLKILDPLEDKQMFIDDVAWNFPSVEVDETKQTVETKSNHINLSEKI